MHILVLCKLKDLFKYIVTFYVSITDAALADCVVCYTSLTFYIIQVRTNYNCTFIALFNFLKVA